MSKKKKDKTLYELYLESQENSTSPTTIGEGKKESLTLREMHEAKYGTSYKDNTTTRYYENDDIAPVKGGNKDSWFKSGGFSDGVDGVGDFFGDLGQTVLGSAGDLGLNIIKGVGRLVEGVADAGVYLMVGADDLLKGNSGNRLKTNLHKDAKEFATRNIVDEVSQGAEDYVDQYSVFGDKSDMVGEGIGQVLGIVATAGIGGAAGLSSAGVTALTTGLTGISGFGSGTSEAYQSGATDAEAYTYGLISGTAEAATELMFGGLGKASKAVGIGKSAIPIDDLLAKKVTSKFTNQIAKNAVEFGIKASAEGFEEVLSGVSQAVGKKVTYMSEKELGEIIADENLLDQFIIGAVTSGFAQSGYVPGMKSGSVREANKTGRDFITGYTQYDQTIIDKEVENRVAEKEKNGQKLTKKEIAKIEEQVQSDLEKGYISTDTIESTFASDEYKAYKDTVEEEDALKAELEELSNMKSGDMTRVQQKRLAELEAMNLEDTTKRDELRKVLDDKLSPVLEYSKLAESYNENARRKEAFTVDLDKYTGKQRDAVERAINSGVLNNTNRSHELVDILSKIEADKGIVFDYADNAKLKESGYAIEGVTVNGYAVKSEGKVVVNVQGAKYWQSTVGHEITHILEGTDAYSELRNALYVFAESKGELQSRRANLTELYKDMGVDIEAELTADLVGDYLFNDKDFINHITGNRNLFQKIYDEIKYLWNVATGREKAEIEKVKREFDKAWKELSVKDNKKTTAKTNGDSDVGITADGNVKHSLSIKHTDGTIEELSDARDLTDEQVINYLNQAKSGKLKWNTYIPVRKDTPQVIIDTLKRVGENADNLSLVMQVRKVQQSMSKKNKGNQNAKGNNIRGHALTAEEIVEIINNLDNPNTIILQTNRYSTNGKQLPNNVAVFVDYNNNGKEGMAVIEFESSIDSEFIGTEFGDTNYHTVVTVFEPDVERQGEPFDYAEELLLNPDNYELEIEQRQPEGSAIGKKHPNTSNELPLSKQTLPQNTNDVKSEFSSNKGTDAKYSISADSDISIDDFTIDDLLSMTDEQFDKVYNSLGLDEWFADDDFVELSSGEDVSIDGISEELNVDAEKIEILVRREGLGNSHIEENRTAVMTQERINRDIADSGARFTPDYAQKYITKISPKDFIDLTVLQKNTDRERFDTYVEGDSGNTMQTFNYESALRDSKQTPYLVIDRTTGRIIGHNGRHRVRALEMAGIESVEIEIELHDEDGGIIKYNSETIPDMAISSQFDTAIETHLSNIIPLNEAHREEIERNYGEKAHANAGVKYSISEDTKNIDNEYMLAVENGDMETAQRLVNEAAEKSGYTTNADYKGSHYAPVAQIDKEYFTDLDKLQELQEESYDLNLYAIANGISLQPDDYFSPNGARWYMYNDADGMESYRAIKPAINSIQQQMEQYGEVKEMPTITVYRAVPKSLKETKMQSGGQWVTPSYQYAVKHGNNALNGNYKIIKETVSAENLWWDANDIREWGFDDGTNYAYRDTKNNRKLLDAVTYDDEGNVIPLSKRFNYRNADERYSISNEGEEFAPIGNFSTPLKDLALVKDDVADVAEDVAPVQGKNAPANDVANLEDIPILPDEEMAEGTYETIKPKRESQPRLKKVTNEAPMPDTFSPMTEEEANAIQDEKIKSDEKRRSKTTDRSKEEIIGESQVAYDKKKVKKDKGKTLSTAIRNFVDKGAVFENWALKHKDRTLMDKYKVMARSESKAQYFMENGKGDVKGLKTIRDQVVKAGLEKEFDLYMKHRHNVHRMKYDLPVFGYDVTSEMSQQQATTLENQHPEFKEWAKEIYKNNNYLRQMMVDAGIITQETANRWAKKYPEYVPLERMTDDSAIVDDNGVGISAPLKWATGGNQEMETLFKTMAHRTEQIFKAIDKNNFGLELKNALGGTVENSKITPEELFDNMTATDEGLLQEGKDGKNPTFTVIENGERVTFEITEEMYEALKPTSDGLAYTNKILNTASNLHKKVLTEYNLFFAARNAIKDSQDVLINSQHPVKTYANMPQAVGELLTGKGKFVQEYWENGGKSNTYFDKAKNTFADKGTFKKLLGFPIEGISKVNDFVEAVPRLAEYIASRKKGATIDAAMLDAARVTTDFSAGGDVTKFLNRNGATFLNASVQGAAQQVRNIREAKANGLKGILKLSAKYAAAGLPALLFNALMWDDDEGYEELSDYVKDNYYIVGKYGDGNFVRIPKGRMVSVIQEAFEQVENFASGDETDFANVFKLAVSNIAPNNPLDNNVVAPIVQAATNKTWYGEDLVPTRLQDVPASEQYDETIDSISKWLGEKTGTSPYKINYLLDQYSGFIGDMVLPALTPEAERGDVSGFGNMIAPVLDQFTVDGTMKNQNVGDFYDTVDKLKVNANSMNATDEDILKSKYMASISSEIGRLYGQKREIQNGHYSDAVKYRKVREIQQQINSLAKESINTYNDVYIDGNYATVGDKHFEYSDGEWKKINDEKVEKTMPLAKALDGYSNYLSYSSDLNNIKADKDAYGKSISGSRKAKVLDYINNLDVDYYTKIILYKSEYPSDDTYNYEIIDYLNNRDDLTYEDRVSILTYLGFTVDAEGNIYWN